jgi:hypothetical protein
VPTFVSNKGNKVSQIDYCYVTDDLEHRTRVTALNRDEEWGPSDHCRVMIEVGPPVERLWTERSFVQEIHTYCGDAAVRTVGSLLEWAHGQNLRVEMKKGMPGMWQALSGDGPAGGQYTFQVRTSGEIVIPFQYFLEPFDEEQTRDEVRTHLNRIPGINIGSDRLNGHPVLPIGVLTDVESLNAFLAVFSDVVARTRVAGT